MHAASPRHAAGRLAFAVALVALIAIGPARSLSAQQAPAPAPRADDVASIDGILTALYASISGPVGEPREWDRFRSLFVPGAILVPTGPNAQGGFSHNVVSPEGYIERSSEQLVAMGFREHEIARVLERFGNIAHAFSTYEGFRGEESEAFLRGVNSIQLWNDGTRWWILSVFWEAERPDNPLPARYLPGTS